MKKILSSILALVFVFSTAAVSFAATFSANDFEWVDGNGDAYGWYVDTSDNSLCARAANKEMLAVFKEKNQPEASR